MAEVTADETSATGRFSIRDGFTQLLKRNKSDNQIVDNKIPELAISHADGDIPTVSQTERLQKLKVRVQKLEEDLERENMMKEAAVNKLYKIQREETDRRLSVISKNSSENAATQIMTAKLRHNSDGEQRRRSLNRSLRQVEQKYYNLKQEYASLEAESAQKIKSLTSQVERLELDSKRKDERIEELKRMLDGGTQSVRLGIEDTSAKESLKHTNSGSNLAVTSSFERGTIRRSNRKELKFKQVNLELNVIKQTLEVRDISSERTTRTWRLDAIDEVRVAELNDLHNYKRGADIAQQELIILLKIAGNIRPVLFQTGEQEVCKSWVRRLQVYSRSNGQSVAM